MKLITELLDEEIRVITEGKDKSLYIEGIFMQSNCEKIVMVEFIPKISCPKRLDVLSMRK